MGKSFNEYVVKTRPSHPDPQLFQANEKFSEQYVMN